MTEFAAHRLSDWCARYGVSRSKAWAEINAGRLRARKNGRVVLITEADGRAWLDGLPVVTPNAA